MDVQEQEGQHSEQETLLQTYWTWILSNEGPFQNALVAGYP